MLTEEKIDGLKCENFFNKDNVKVEFINNDELRCIEKLIDKLKNEYNSIEKEEFANHCALVAHELPFRLRQLLLDFRNYRFHNGFIVLKGFPIFDDRIGNTPSHWDAKWENTKYFQEEIFQCLISSCIGEIFGWRTQENGRFLRHIVPIESEKNEQLGGSSDVTLLWHNEEAFHPYRSDLMSLMCYRNNEKAMTFLCSTSQMDIPQTIRNILSQPRYFIHPDKSHFPENNTSKHWSLSHNYFNKIYAFLSKPEPVSVLSGEVGRENLLIDEAFMEALPGDKEAQDSLNWLYQHMNERKSSVIMEAGDLVLIDNRVTAHGRSNYKPHYGEKARWLRRVNITTDLLKSHSWKEKPHSRIIG